MASKSADSFESIIDRQLVIVPRKKPAIATNAPKKIKKDSGMIDGTGPAVASDSSSAPFGDNDTRKDHLGELTPAMSQLHLKEWHATGMTSLGTYITTIAPRFAMRNGPQIKTLQTDDRKLKKTDQTYVEFLNWKYDIKGHSTTSIQWSERYGRALCFLEQVAEAGSMLEWELCEGILEEGSIDYEKITIMDPVTKEEKKVKSGKILMYHPKVRRGNEYIYLDIKPENAVLFIADPDPFGNKEQGIPQTIGAYRSINRIENIEDSSARMYKNRGLGLLHLMIEGADPETCEEYAKEYGNPDEFTVMATDERFQVNVHEGIKNGYNLPETIGTFKEGVSQATGYPQMSLKGSADSQAGSETGSDTRETVLQTIQERYEKFILKVYYMVDAKEKKKNLKEKQLYLTWEHTIKMDRQKEVNVKATVAGYINAVGSLLTVNQAKEELGLPPEKDDKIGNMNYAEYKQQFAPMPFGAEPGGEDKDKEKGEEKGPNVPPPPKYENREVKNQLSKKEDTLVQMFKRGATLNKALEALRWTSEDGQAINRTVASELYKKVRNGEL